MSVLPLQFELSPADSVKQFITALKNLINLQVTSPHSRKITFYDSFDWRLYSNNITCEIELTAQPATLSLSNLKTGLVFADIELNKIPAFGWEVDAGQVRDKLSSILEMRALIPIVTLESQNHLLNIVNKEEKTVLRLVIEEYADLQNRITLKPLKGYNKALANIVHILENKLQLKPANPSILIDALQTHSITPNVYSSKQHITLAPDMRSDIACKYIYSQLLNAMRLNEPGTIDNIDSEFLHDFRVAVRRTRSGLSQLKGILPPEITANFSDFFAWLGQITSPARDMDVYLLDFDHYKNTLPEDMREDLNPLRKFLIVKQQSAHSELVKELKSAKYLNTLNEWEQYLNTPVDNQPEESNAAIPVKQFADHRIWRIYKRILKQGNAIDDNSPATALHDLRKNCKKLRYLMEFFQSLYPEKRIKSLIKALKNLQELLGAFQDYEVQEKAIKQFGDEMMSEKISVKTFLAMGVLVQNLQQHRLDARSNFTACFTDFKKAENQDAFRSLFAGK